MPLITRLVSTRYKSTVDAERALARLSQASGWRDHLLSRLAISRSLQVRSAPDVPSRERKGKELRGETLLNQKHDPDYVPWVAAMIAQHAGRGFRSDEDAIDLIHAHWHRGLALLCTDLDQHGGKFSEMIISLARDVAESVGPLSKSGGPSHRSDASYEGATRPIVVPIGRTAPDADLVTVTLNDTRRYSNCHLAVGGMSGSGKTQMIKRMLADAARGCDASTGIIFIDFAKGDVAEDQRFAEMIEATVLRLPGDILPIGPFHLPDYSDDSIRLAAEEKREAYTALFQMLGPKQEGRLAEAIRQSYEDLHGDPEPAPDFAFVQQKLAAIYSHDGIPPDSLTELLRQLNAYRLFWSRASGTAPVTPLHTQRWIVDIHELGGLKEVTAFTLIEQLYREMRRLPDSAVDATTGLRHVRCILAIDEAQYYLKARNRFLQGIIREGRSKGFAIMLMCQSPDDFDQDDFDYTEQLQFTFMLQCKTEPRAVQRLLGVSRDEAKRLAADLGRMEPLHGIGQLPGEVRGRLSRFRISPFFEME